MLRNWILGTLATILWIAQYLVYFARDIAEWWARRGPDLPPEQWRWPGETEGPLEPLERHRFPPPEPPAHPVREAEVVPSPRGKRR